MINWKIRLKNRVWLLTAIPVVLGAAYSVFGLFGWVPPIAETAVENVLIAIVGALAVLGIVEDPTTAGVGDSKQALDYKEPKPKEAP